MARADSRETDLMGGPNETVVETDLMGGPDEAAEDTEVMRGPDDAAVGIDLRSPWQPMKH